MNATRIEVAHQIATVLSVRLPHLFAFDGEPDFHPGSRINRALSDLLDGCDDATADSLLDLVRVGLQLAGRT